MNTNMKTTLFSLLLAALTLPATAAIVTWTGTTNDRWSDGGNWSSGSPPTAADDAVFAGAGSLEVDVDGVFTVKSLTLSGNYYFFGNSGFVAVSELTITDQVTHSGNGGGQFYNFQHPGFAGVTVKFPNGAPIAFTGSGTGDVVFFGENPFGHAGVAGAPKLTMSGGTFLFLGTHGLGVPPTVVPDTLTLNGGYFCLCETNAAKFTTVTINAGATMCSQNSGQTWDTSEAAHWVVNVGGTLKWAGRLDGPVTSVGTLSAGCSPGEGYLLGDLTLGAGSRLEFELDQPNVVGSGSDLFNVTGNVTLDGTVDVLPQAGFGAGTYRLFNYTGALVNNGLTLGVTPSGYQCTLNFATAGQVNLVVTDNANCCPPCAPPYPLSVNVTVGTGYNYLANPLCRGTNNTLGALLPNVPDTSEVFLWDVPANAPGAQYTYYDSVGWFDAASNPADALPLEPGVGFIFLNPGASSFVVTFQGCEPICPRPCGPDARWQLLGVTGTSPGNWTNLFSCPPVCGTVLRVWNKFQQQFQDYTYLNGSWTPSEPQWESGTSVLVSVQPNTNCLGSLPVITQQPESLELPPGGIATFSVAAVGAEPLSFQWALDGVRILDATNSTLAIGPVSTNLAGIYTVEVSNHAGATQSQGATLVVTLSSTTVKDTLVQVDARVCFNNGTVGAVAACIAQWPSTFLGGSYSAGTKGTLLDKWCKVGGGLGIWWPCPDSQLFDSTQPNPVISASGPIPSGGSGPFWLLGHKDYFQGHCAPSCWPPLTFPPIGWRADGFGYVHTVTATMTVGNGDGYLFAPKDTPPLGAQQLPPTQCGPCPPETVNICECATVVELCFVDCLTRKTVAINGDTFAANLLTGPQAGQSQAWGNVGTTMCRKILLRSGERYSLTMDYHTGSSYFNDRINWRTSFPVDTTVHNCSNDGVLRIEVEVGRDDQDRCVGICTNNCPPPCENLVFGNLDLLCECEHNLPSNWSFMQAWGGPWGIQQRWDHVGVNPATGCAEGEFNLINLLAGSYNAQGRMCFRAGHNYQWLSTPITSFTAACNQPLNLGDTFVLDCGWVRGDIFLCGPKQCVPTGCDFLNALIRETNPELLGSSLGGSSYVAAFGPASAQARTQFPGTLTSTSPNCEFRGNYRLSLGGLNRGQSVWTANQLVLRFNSAAPPLDSTVAISDQSFLAQNIVPGALPLVNDHNYGSSLFSVGSR
jgi:hypothetical protein